MIRANIKQKALVINILATAFEDNQSVNFIVQQDKRRLKRIEALMDYSFEMCHHFGQVWLSENKEACALILYPHSKKFSILAIWLDIKLIFKAIGLSRVLKTLRREGAIKRIQPQVPMAYLWFIGVDPRFQHKGFGTSLLQEIISEANSKGLPVFLETSTLPNLPWYERIGFRIYNELDLGYTLYFLKHPLDKL